MIADKAEDLWNKFEYFSGYGFNKSHAVSYSIISYQCAWLWNYYPSEWMAAFLDKEPETRKEKAINIAKKYGFKIAPLDINKSGTVWEISDDGKTLIQPLTSIKGLGMAAIEQILDHRPFTNAEDLLFREGVSYSKFNKKALDALTRGGAVDEIMDDRFTGRKHFWSACVVERPKNLKKLCWRTSRLIDPKEISAKRRSFSLRQSLRACSLLTLSLKQRQSRSSKKSLSHQSLNLM